jgi:inosose dehydratase
MRGDEAMTTGTASPADRTRSRITLGSAPDSWGVWFPDDPNQTPWQRFLDEFAEAGYRWLELGPYGYLPTEPDRLREELDRRGIRVSGQAVFGGLHRPEKWEADLAEARRTAELVTALGGRYVIGLPDLYRDLDGNFTEPLELDAGQWRTLLRAQSELGRILKEEYGLALVFHPHADSHVGAQDEVERFVEGTDPATVSLCLDTGHIAYYEGDNLQLIHKYPDRIGYVHVKQVDPAVLKQVKEENLGFAEAVRRGVMIEPPQGVPAVEPVVDALNQLDADLFMIVEQDLYPCDPDVPLPIAVRTRSYLNGCGVGPLPGNR